MVGNHWITVQILRGIAGLNNLNTEIFSYCSVHSWPGFYLDTLLYAKNFPLHPLTQLLLIAARLWLSIVQTGVTCLGLCSPMPALHNTITNLPLITCKCMFLPWELYYKCNVPQIVGVIYMPHRTFPLEWKNGNLWYFIFFCYSHTLSVLIILDVFASPITSFLQMAISVQCS